MVNNMRKGVDKQLDGLWKDKQRIIYLNFIFSSHSIGEKPLAHIIYNRYINTPDKCFTQ
jgi:hypothetical protein